MNKIIQQLSNYYSNIKDEEGLWLDHKECPVWQQINMCPFPDNLP